MRRSDASSLSGTSAPVVARSLALLGRNRFSLDDYERAARLLAEATLVADEAGDDQLRADTWLALASHSRTRGELPDARRQIATARSGITRLGGDADLEVKLLREGAVCSEHEGHGAEAVALAGVAVRRAEAAGLPALALGRGVVPHPLREIRS